MMLKRWIMLSLSVWLFVSGLNTSLEQSINIIIAGMIIAIIGFWDYKYWQNLLNGLLGLWIMVCGLSSKLMNPANFVLVGLVVFILSVWVLDTAHDKDYPQKMNR